MKLANISTADFLRSLRGDGVCLRIGPFQTRVQTRIAALGRAIHVLYADFPVVEKPEFSDFHVRMLEPKMWRRFYRPQVVFYFDDHVPFKPLPRNHAMAMFEWSLNWCIETEANQYLLVHAAIVERDGFAAILAAPPGSGKSTLAAALINRGWRLLSDELTMIDPANGTAVGLARPVSLKNESIEVIRAFAPGAVFGPIADATGKGSVAHLKPPADSVNRVAQRARPRWIIFPQFKSGAPALLKPHSKAVALLRFADHAFNYSQYGASGFELMAHLIDSCDCYEFTYSRLGEAIEAFETIAAGAHADRMVQA